MDLQYARRWRGGLLVAREECSFVAVPDASQLDGRVLASLLPGLREIRAPLAAGYLWMAFLWLVLRTRIPGAQEADGIIGGIYEISAAAGRPAVLAAVSFLAYVAGVLSAAVSGFLLALFSQSTATASIRVTEARRRAARLIRWLDPARRRPFYHGPTATTERFESPIALGQRGVRLLREVVIERLTERLATEGLRPDDQVSEQLNRIIDKRLADEVREALEQATDRSRPRAARRLLVEQYTDIDAYVAALAGDLPLLPARLLGRDQELYGAYDRLRAEAEFRASIALPMVPLACALTAQIDRLWLLALALPALLFAEAIIRNRAAGDLLAEALRAQRTESLGIRAVEEISSGPLRLMEHYGELREQILRTRRRALGEDHQDTIKAMSEWAAVWGRTRRARKLLEQVVALASRWVDPEEETRESSAAKLALARFLYHDGKYERAREMQTHVLTSMPNLPSDDPLRSSVMHDLADSLLLLGRLQEARELQEETLLTRVRVLGDTHPDTLETMSRLALTLEKLGVEPTRVDELRHESYEWKSRLQHPGRIRSAADDEPPQLVSDALSAAFDPQEIDLAKRLLPSRSELGIVDSGTEELFTRIGLAIVRLADGDLRDLRDISAEARLHWPDQLRRAGLGDLGSPLPPSPPTTNEA